MTRKKLIVILCMVLMLGITGCENDEQGTDGLEDSSPVVNELGEGKNVLRIDEVQNNKDVSTREKRLETTAMEALDIYMKKYPNAKVEEIEFDMDSDLGLYVYEVEGYEGNQKYELKISAKDGSIVKEKMEMKEHHQSDGEITKSHIEKIDTLVNEALKDAGEGANLDEWSLEFENGIAVLDVEVDIVGGDDIEYKFNVETGKLITKTK